MKPSILSIISFIFLVGINKQVVAQNVRKAETKIEPKAITPVREAEVKETPRAESIAQPIQHTEITPIKEPEIRQETQVEVAPTPLPVEEPKVESVPEKAEWVKTEIEPVKPVENNAAKQATPTSRIPIYNRQMKPMVRRAAIKPIVLDATKKP